MPDIRIAVFDDHPVMRMGIVHFVARQPGMVVVAEGGCAVTAIDAIRSSSPDLVLLDLRMPGGGGLAVLDAVMPHCPELRVLMLSMAESEEDVRQALRKGACGWMSKVGCGEELVTAVTQVMEGRLYVTPSLAAQFMLREQAPPPRPVPEAVGRGITTRERAVADCVAQGLSNKEIGRELALSDKTVRQYLTRVLQKLRVRNRVEAALVLNGARLSMGQ